MGGRRITARALLEVLKENLAIRRGSPQIGFGVRVTATVRGLWIRWVMRRCGLSHALYYDTLHDPDFKEFVGMYRSVCAAERARARDVEWYQRDIRLYSIHGPSD